MGSKYSTKSATGYNTSPPSDDGTANAANQLNWSKHITKIGDPIKNLADAINAALVAHFDVDTIAKTAAYTTTADDDRRTVECTSSPTITLGAAASMGTGYVVTVKCVSGTTTVATSDTIDGSASNRTLTAGASETYVVNQAANAYLIQQLKGITADDTATLTNKTLTSPVINTGVSGTAILDEDDMASDSDTQLATQQSIKAYVDASGWTKETAVTLSGDDQVLTTALASGDTEIDIHFTGITMSASSNLALIQLGTSGPTWITSGYNSVVVWPSDAMAATTSNTTSGIAILDDHANIVNGTYSGIVRLRKIGSVWMANGTSGSTVSAQMAQMIFSAELSGAGTLTHIRLSTSSTATFTAGDVQVWHR